MGKRLRTVHHGQGQYSMSTRKGMMRKLLEKFGDAIFDAGDRGSGSGREQRKQPKQK